MIIFFFFQKGQIQESQWDKKIYILRSDMIWRSGALRYSLDFTTCWFRLPVFHIQITTTSTLYNQNNAV